MVLGHLRELPPESAAEAAQRHARVAERRAGPILLAHRGASSLATENTLEAYAAAINYGADGCEIDIRRLADGTLALFHDDMLDRLTDGFGRPEDLTYPELISLRPRLVHGTANDRTRPPTLVALLALARQTAMLLHLDVKAPGLEAEIGALLDAADMWDHVVAVNRETTPQWKDHPKLRLLRYKGGLYEDRGDLDPVAVRAALAKPGQMLMLEDPRLAARELGRPAWRPLAKAATASTRWGLTAARPAGDPGRLVATDYLRALEKRVAPDSVADLLKLLRLDLAAPLPASAAGAVEEQRRAERILERAWAARQLGEMASESPPVVDQLVTRMRDPGLHTDWLINGLDGHRAARALAKLRATETVPAMIETFRRVDPRLAFVRNPQWTNNPVGWTDWRKLAIIPLLGELRTGAGKKFLLEYVAWSEQRARELSPPQFDEATKALLRHRLSGDELAGLLRSPNSVVRGTAILVCLDQPTRARTQALREAAPWALSLPRAKR